MSSREDIICMKQKQSAIKNCCKLTKSSTEGLADKGREKGKKIREVVQNIQHLTSRDSKKKKEREQEKQ